MKINGKVHSGRILAAIAVIGFLLVLSGCSKNTTTAITTTTSTASGGTQVTIALTAQNMAFDKNSITVAAGANVTINFNNKDTIPHNFALYTNNSAATPAIFQGQIVTGPTTVTYTFKAPANPGTYFFRCDVHPTSMTGSFIVQ